MKKMTLALAVLLASVAAQADDFLCQYHARISNQDKHNSSGKNLTRSGYTKATVASIIRQDRANYYAFKKRDAEDEADCLFQQKKNRVLLEKLIKDGNVSPAAIKIIIEDHPLIRVDVYDQHLEIHIVDIEEGDQKQESFIQ